jgi:hypothetical protein
VLLRWAVVRAGEAKPATGTDITDASLPHGRLRAKQIRSLGAGANLVRSHYPIRWQSWATEYPREPRGTLRSSNRHDSTV